LRKQDLPTPALLLDLDAFEANIALMQAHITASGKHLRPHAKAHKCPEIARRQIAAGAVGVCVATVAEAELMGAAGIPSLLLTSPLADPLKIARAVSTGAQIVVDHPRQAQLYQEAAAESNKTIEVLVDLDIGDHRTGARPDDALELAQYIDRAPNLKLRGLQAYSVLGSHNGGFEGRKKVSTDGLAVAAHVFAHLRATGLNIDTLTGGSTGTWDIDSQIAALTEFQAGSYVLMDMAYAKEGVTAFRPALTVLATVVSANHRNVNGTGWVTLDSGTKSFSTDRGYAPQPLAFPHATTRWGGDEFLYLELHPGPDQATSPTGQTPSGAATYTSTDVPLPNLTDKLELIPPHCDPTANLYDRIHACRGDVVERVWPLKRLSFAA
jgi:D-serine deaminase-like pyridoxal phosphate-dependent protein